LAVEDLSARAHEQALGTAPLPARADGPEDSRVRDPEWAPLLAFLDKHARAERGGSRPSGTRHTGGPLDRWQVSKRFKSALKRAGVREVRFHDLRHSFGTRCAANS